MSETDTTSTPPADTYDEIDASPAVARIVFRTPRAQRHMLAILIHEDGSTRAMDRAGMLAWLRAEALDDLAAEASRHRPQRGELLVLSMRSDPPRFAIIAEDPSQRRKTGTTLVERSPVERSKPADDERVAARAHELAECWDRVR